MIPDPSSKTKAHDSARPIPGGRGFRSSWSERRPGPTNPLIQVSGSTPTFGVCARCGSEIFRCADSKCERGGWFSEGQHVGDGRHECYLLSGLESAPHVPR
jgi:hypothetical protein